MCAHVTEFNEQKVINFHRNRRVWEMETTEDFQFIWLMI